MCSSDLSSVNLRNRNCNDDVKKLQVLVLQLVLNVNIAATTSIVRWPAIYCIRRGIIIKYGLTKTSVRDLTCKWNLSFVCRLISPLENSDIRVEWEWFLCIFKTNLTLILEKFFVNIWMSLEWNSLVLNTGPDNRRGLGRLSTHLHLYATLVLIVELNSDHSTALVLDTKGGNAVNFPAIKFVRERT